MKLPASKLGLTLSLINLVLFLLPAIIVIYDATIPKAGVSFAGLPAIALASPWALLYQPLLDPYIAWYDSFAEYSDLLYGLLATTTLLPGVILNALILYFIGKFIGSIVKRMRFKTEFTIPLKNGSQKNDS